MALTPGTLEHGTPSGEAPAAPAPLRGVTASVVPSLRHAPPPGKAQRGPLKYLLGAAVLLALGAAVLLWRGRGGSSETPQTITVQKEPFGGELHEIGAVEAQLETQVLSRFGGDIVWLIPDGTEVEAGAPIARFDTKATEEDLESREKDLVIKQEAVRRAEVELRATEQRYEITLRQREIDVEQAQLDRAKVYEKPKPEERLDAELTLKSAELDLQRAEVDLQGFDQLAKQGFASEAKLKEKQLDVATRRVNFAKAKSIYDLTLQGETKEKKRLSDLAVSNATKKLNIERFNRDADLAVARAALELTRVELANFERDLLRRRQQLEWATVRAPVRGHVVFTDVFKGSSKTKSPVQVGETRTAGSELCMICDTTSLKVRVLINESDVKDVAIGQKARVTLPALPGKTFEAVVTDLGVVAQDKNAALSSLALRRSGEAFVNVVTTKLQFVNLAEEDRRRIRVGFTAEVFLQTGEKKLSLVVPWSAVQYSGGMPYADVWDGARRERRALKLGRSTHHRVEIVEGLRDHEQVVDLLGTARGPDGNAPAGQTPAPETGLRMRGS